MWPKVSVRSKAMRIGIVPSWGFTKDLTAVEVKWSDAVEIGFTEEGERTMRDVKVIKVTHSDANIISSCHASGLFLSAGSQ